MALSWDWVIALLIIVGIILGFWMKLTGQTLTELFDSIKELFTGAKEDTAERVESLVYYE